MKATIGSIIPGICSALCALATSLAQDFVIPIPEGVRSLAVQPNGQIIVARGSAIARFNSDGTLDTTFDRSGHVSALGIENASTVLAKDSFHISRFNLDGVRVTAIPGFFEAFLLQPDGKILVADFRSLSRLNPDGTPDPSFTSPSIQLGSIFDPAGLALQEDGKIVIGPTRDGSVQRFNADGTADASFTSPVFKPPFVRSILAQPDGKILVGGHFMAADNTGRNGLARLNADGTLDASFDPASEHGTLIHSFALQANSKIILAGLFTSMAGQPATNIARLNPDGTLDATFPNASSSSPGFFGNPLALQEDGAILAGFSTNLVRITNPEPATQSFSRDGSTLTWLRGGSSPEVFHTRFQSSLDGVIWNDLGAGTRFAGGSRLEGANIPAGARLRVRGYVTGTSYYFDHVPGAPGLLAQSSDRTNDVNTVSIFRVFAEGLEPLAFQWFKDSQPLTGATSSTLVLSNVTGAAAGGYHVIVSNSEGSSTSRVAQLTVSDPILLTQPASVWANAGSTVSLSVSAVGTGLSYQWKKDGQSIPGANSSNLVIANASSADTGNYQLVLTGTYGTRESAIASVHVNHALADSWNPTYETTSEWFPIQTAAVHNDTLFIGGLFRTVGTPARHHLIKFTEGSTLDPLFAPEPTGAEAVGVSTLTVAPNGQLMVGGTFLTIAGQPQAHVARLNPDGTLDQQFRPVFQGPKAGRFTQVTAVEFLLDGRILIAGDFFTVNGQPRPGIARLFPDGTLDPSFNPDTNSVPPLSWALLVQPDGKIILDGWDLRRLNPDGTPDTAFTALSLTNKYGNPFLLANNQLLVNSKAGISRLNPDGSVDLTFPGVDGTLEAVQADGKFILSKLAELIPIVTVTSNSTTTTHRSRYALLRINPDGSEDRAFSPTFDDYATVKAMEADGSFIVTGYFTNAAGQALPKLARVRNTEPASQSLTLNGATATWLRGGTSPEVTRTTFEFSSDGLTWTNLGAGARIAGGWQLDGLQLNPPGTLRARGFLQGSIFESSIELPSGLRLAAARNRADNRQMIFNVTAAGTTPVVLEMSTDLKQWTSLQTLAGAQPLQLTVTNLSLPRAFYRLRQQ
jgi:uncharacterized delta-60 repeat protein